MSGTPEKILEHLLEMMPMDSQMAEPGTGQHRASSASNEVYQYEDHVLVFVPALALALICMML